MPYPISVRPARPGDGSGLRERPPKEKPQPEKYDEAYAQTVEQRRQDAVESKAYAAFRELFTEADA